MRQRRLVLFSLIIALTTLAGGCAAAGPASNETTNAAEGVGIGNRAPDFQLPALDGRTVKLSEQRGNPVLLNFWATWCPPCRFEAPFLDEINTAYAPKGLVMLTVDIGENATIIQNFMTSLNISLPVLLDSDSAIAKRYAITGIPTTFILDKDGIIRFKLIGAFQNKAAIEQALKTVIP